MPARLLLALLVAAVAARHVPASAQADSRNVLVFARTESLDPVPGACLVAHPVGSDDWERRACDGDARDTHPLQGLVQMEVPADGSAFTVEEASPPPGHRLVRTDPVNVTWRGDESALTVFFYYERADGAVPRAAGTSGSVGAGLACAPFDPGSIFGAMTPEAVGHLTGCRLSEPGKWFVPTGPDDPRLPGGPPLDDDERRRTQPLRRTLETQLAEFNAALAATLFDAGRSWADAVEERRAQYNPLEPVLPFHEGYQQLLTPWLLDPSRKALSDYVAWWQQRRAAAVAGVVQYLDPLMGDFLLGAANRAPWPWELADPLTLDEYLDYALANGLVPGDSGAGAAIGDAGLDCDDFASQDDAQAFFEATGAGDRYGLDEDGDGVACERLP